MRKVYVFSGLGADKRVFQNIDFGDLSPVHIEWKKPEKNETLQQYARRMSSVIKEKNPLLIGLSYGGMVATEVAKYLDAKKLILISSVSTGKEIPLLIRFFGQTGFINFLPVRIMLKPNKTAFWFFGIRTREERDLFSLILRDTDSKAFKWSLKQIATWNNDTPFHPTARIHGLNDRVLPVKNIRFKVITLSGGHFICHGNAAPVSDFIQNELSGFL